MNKMIITLSCFLTLTALAQAPKRFQRFRGVAQEENTSVNKVENKSSANSKGNIYYVGLERSNWDYTEEVDGERFMQDKGQLYGAFIEAKLPVVENNLFARGKISYLTGATKYDGSLQSDDGSPREPYQAKTQNNILETRAELVGALHFLPTHAIAPTLGLNYRSLVNPENSKDTHDYTRHAEYITAPIGLGFMGDFASFSYGLGAEYHYLIQAQTISYLTEEIGVIKNAQEKGQGKEVNGFVSFKVASNNTFKIGLYYREWNFEDSKPVRSGRFEFVEPKNKTQMSGINFSIGF